VTEFPNQSLDREVAPNTEPCHVEFRPCEAATGGHSPARDSLARTVRLGLETFEARRLLSASVPSVPSPAPAETGPGPQLGDRTGAGVRTGAAVRSQVAVSSRRLPNLAEPGALEAVPGRQERSRNAGVESSRLIGRASTLAGICRWALRPGRIGGRGPVKDRTPAFRNSGKKGRIIRKPTTSN
jgi:hypothetical protein